jgi:hypothetical protein
MELSEVGGDGGGGGLTTGLVGRREGVWARVSDEARGRAHARRNRMELAQRLDRLLPPQLLRTIEHPKELNYSIALR